LGKCYLTWFLNCDRSLNADVFRILCDTPSASRTALELDYIYSILNPEKFFQSIHTRAKQYLCCRCMTGKRVPNWEAVVKQGEPGDAFYVVLKGQLSVEVDGVMLESKLGVGGSFGEKALEPGATKVRKMPSWPRSWANFSLLSLYSHRNAWASLHLLGQPNTFPARRRSRSGRRLSRRWSSASSGCCRRTSTSR
jgi:hypothetical protein